MSPLRVHSVSFSSILTYVCIGVLAVLLCGYVIFQARLLIEGPQITLVDEPSSVQSERQIALTGTTKNITEITLNGRQIVTDQAGYFEESIVLENGYTIVSLEAHDRYGRKTTLEREFVYTPLSLLP